MKILVDADACPVISIVEHIAEKYGIPIIYLITGLKNLDVEVPDKLVFELPVSALRVLTSLVVCGELLMKQKSQILENARNA